MKLSEAIERGKNKSWLCANIRKNPSSPAQWFVMLVDKNQLPHMLVDDADSPVISDNLDYFTELMKKFGIREFTVYL